MRQNPPSEDKVSVPRPLYYEAVAFLVVFRLLKKLLPFRRLASVMGRPQVVSPADLPPHQAGEAGRIGEAVRLAAARYPWVRNCFTQALAAQAMLRRRRIAATLYLGVSSDPGTGFRAHAWLRCGSELITGGAGSDEFRAISTYASGPKSAGDASGEG